MKINGPNDSPLQVRPIHSTKVQPSNVHVIKPVLTVARIREPVLYQATDEHIDALTKLYRLLDHSGHSDLVSQARQLQQYLQQHNILQMALKIGQNDPARSEILLHYNLLLAQAESREADARTTRNSIEELRQLYGKKIRAGFNTASAIALFSSDPRHRRALRDLYYKIIDGKEPLACLMEELLSHLGAERFRRGLRTLQRALAEDVAALEPSLPKKVLRALLWSLSACGCLSSLLKDCERLLDRLHCVQTNGVMTPLIMGKRILRFCGNGLLRQELMFFTEEVLGQSAQFQQKLHSDLYSLFLSLPPVLWRDLKAREKSLLVVQGLFDKTGKSNRLYQGLMTSSVNKQ
ncbi:HrpJ domain-containing protein [Pseudomonas fluorescens]|uniref:HrpJ domain-containing protein n=1 Tax=Pseudomonas fluorescens TaxID=294 RepID=UPI001BE68019|nr:HrpJ domain-containing protein [Pseudomonas fluorescens]MBT2375468.1 SepL/TyeA/HrpJ family type III secretion system gatekeeper [Pseudomonas fluorescens]